APDAVVTLAGAVSPRGVVYADEDETDASGAHRGPRFKPAYSPEMLLSTGYTGRPFAMGQEVADQLPAFVAGDASALEHECALAACEIASSVEHIPEVLCHRFADGPAPHSGDPSSRHVVAALER